MENKAKEALELLVRAAQAARLTYNEHAACDKAASYLLALIQKEDEPTYKMPGPTGG